MAKVVIPQVNLAPDFTAVVTGSHAGKDRVTSLHRWHQQMARTASILFLLLGRYWLRGIQVPGAAGSAGGAGLRE